MWFLEYLFHCISIDYYMEIDIIMKNKMQNRYFLILKQ